jgi:hypothetical protein
MISNIMSTLQQAIEYAKQNPNDARTIELMNQIKSGKMDGIARQEGIDLTGKSQTFAAQPAVQEQAEQGVGGNLGNTLAQSIGQTIPGVGMLASKETRGDLRELFAGFQSNLVKRQARVTESRQASKAGEQSGVRGFTQAVGQTMGLVADNLADTFIAGAKIALPQGLEDKAGDAIIKALEPLTPVIMEGEQWLQKVEAQNPALGRDIRAALGAVELGSEFVGAGVMKRSAQVAGKGLKAGAEVVEAGAKSVGDAVGNTARAIGENIPSAGKVAEFEITRALGFTQSDVKNAFKSTGNNPGRWIADKNLIGATAEETVANVQQKLEVSFAEVRKQIGNVETKYTPKSIPRYKQALTEIEKVVNTTPGLEQASKEVSALLKKKNPTLSDAQRVKELMDEHFSLFKITGDVKESAAKKGLAEMRSDIRGFIEDEVKKSSGVDIKPLNNDVATGKTITGFISDRASRGLTRSFFSMGDLATFGAGSLAGSPLAGIGLVIAKKLGETPGLRLRFARWVDKLSDAKKAKLEADLNNGKLPKDVEDVIGPIDEGPGGLGLGKYSDSQINEIRSELLGGKTLDKQGNWIKDPKQKAVIVDSDTIKKAHNEFDPDNPQLLHEDSSAISKQVFKDAIDADKSGVFKATAGSAGSGKSEVIIDGIKSQPGVIFDGVMGGFDSAKAKIDYALSKGKMVEIHTVYTPPELAYLFNRMRSRTVPDGPFSSTVTKHRNNMPKLYREYGDKIEWHVYSNDRFGIKGREITNNIDIEDFLVKRADDGSIVKESIETMSSYLDNEGIGWVKENINKILDDLTKNR